ncbi:HesA/MoeB/ThiF family protein [Turneriella parva]|uniref:UBA/THIF-type NAD/FAD binding protein n=1 Tax=Turneriella parva (strain ATCC BAA-1111 / DSM 21527 / NCTC 11395 / H) TaxID=869212 RepID=I4B9Q3_TURPD|nr:ThiF family adenylyltransferase [Turneriella parva]AFM14010.1 UBA/THIF-type NAD/FAD binding protein [Turneriella parva DSM 21527]
MRERFQLKKFYRISDYQNSNVSEFPHLVSLGYDEILAKQVQGNDVTLSLLAHLDGTKSLGEICDILSKAHKISEAEIFLQVRALIDAGLLLPEHKSELLSTEEIIRYDRHLLFYSIFTENPIWHQEKLAKATVAILGVGGIGSWVAYNLACCGVGRLILIDSDFIETSNLTRQILYGPSDVGKSKIEVAVNRLRNFNPFINVIGIEKKIQNYGDLDEILPEIDFAGIDFIIQSADKPEKIHFWLDEFAYRRKISYAFAGYIEILGVVGPIVIPDKTSCLMCAEAKIHDFENADLKAIQDRFQAPSFGPINSIVSSFVVLETIKLLLGMEESQLLNQRLTYNFLKNQIDYEPYPKNPNCTQCGRKND